MLHAAPLAENQGEARQPPCEPLARCEAPPENRGRHGQDGPKHHSIFWTAPTLDGGRW